MIPRFSFIETFMMQFSSITATFAPGVFSLVGVFLNPSIRSVGVFLIGTMLGLMFSVVTGYYEDINLQRKTLEGYLKRFSKCNFKSYPISDYSTNEMLLQPELDNYPISTKAQIRLKRDIKIYVVERGQSQVLPSQMAAYPSFYGTSFIFVRDSPDKINPLGKFFIFHEFAHSAWRNMASSSFTNWGWKLFALSLLWAVINIQPSLTSFILLAGYVLLIVLLQPIIRQLLIKQHYVEEISADHFSIRCLSQKDLIALSNYLQAANGLPRDLSLSESQNLERSNILIKDAEQVINSTEYNNTPILFVFTRLSIYLSFLLALPVPIMGYFSRSPSTSLVCGNSILLAITVIILVWLIEKQTKYQQEIENFFVNN
jgi:membrane protein YdbS with pleckstrin-like domain